MSWMKLSSVLDESVPNHFTRASGVKGPNASGGVQPPAPAVFQAPTLVVEYIQHAPQACAPRTASSELYSAFDNTLKQKQEMSHDQSHREKRRRLARAGHGIDQGRPGSR